MSTEAKWEHFFKPEVRVRGQEDFLAGLVFVSNASDTQIQGMVKASTPLKVSFLAQDISSPTFTVDCSCTSSAKGTFCKHIWAMLLLVVKKHPDFLDSKKMIDKVTLFGKVESPFKAKQAEYKKAQYQKQKVRAKEQRKALKNKGAAPAATSYPEPVAEALAYFSENGFPMEASMDGESVNHAKKILSRVFHPDKGGTHEEALILNQHYDTLIEFLEG
jgi:FtsZ-interacting cell division protein YlmF